MGFYEGRISHLWGLPQPQPWLSLSPLPSEPRQLCQEKAGGMIVSTLQTESPRLREEAALGSRKAGPRLAFPWGVLAKGLKAPGQAAGSLPAAAFLSMEPEGKGRARARTELFTHREASVCVSVCV